jgi:hypothetical protein
MGKLFCTGGLITGIILAENGDLRRLNSAIWGKFGNMGSAILGPPVFSN